MNEFKEKTASDMDERKPTFTELLRNFAALKGLPIKENPNELTCRITDNTFLILFRRPVVSGRDIFYGKITDSSAKFAVNKFLTKDNIDFMRNAMEESILILELRARIMNPENLETAERMARKRRKLQEVYDLLSSYHESAEIKVTVKLPYAAGDKVKEAVISEETFNALVCKLAEDEINHINKFVESL